MEFSSKLLVASGGVRIVDSPLELVTCSHVYRPRSSLSHSLLKPSHSVLSEFLFLFFLFTKVAVSNTHFSKNYSIDR